VTLMRPDGIGRVQPEDIVRRLSLSPDKLEAISRNPGALILSGNEPGKDYRGLSEISAKGRTIFGQCRRSAWALQKAYIQSGAPSNGELPGASAGSADPYWQDPWVAFATTYSERGGGDHTNRGRGFGWLPRLGKILILERLDFLFHAFEYDEAVTSVRRA